jgi:hypothetical protein
MNTDALIGGCLFLIAITYVFNTFWKEDLKDMIKLRRKQRQIRL